jgi:prepilin peptidase CpaA
MSLVLALVAVALLGFAAWRDLATRTIPDGVSLALAAIGLAVRSFQGLEAVAASLLTAFLLGAALFALHSRGLLGGGDVKLATALAVGLAPFDTWNLVVATALAGGLLGLLYLALPHILPAKPALLAGRAAALPRRFVTIELWRIRRRGPLPYGVAIAAGGTLVLLQTILS